jgi:hypothetical protein
MGTVIERPPPTQNLVPRRVDVGSIGWARQTNGLLLTRDERLEMWRQAGLYWLDGIQRKLRHRMGGASDRLARIDPAEIRFPDSAAARESEERAVDELSEVWVNHGYRTYLWAWILGKHDGLEFDEEVLYVGSMVHDIGLADSNRAVEQRCFSLTAVEVGDEIAERVGWDRDRSERLADSIVRHINLWIPRRKHPEGYLLHVGTKLDVVGLRYGDIAPEAIALVIDRYPRLNFKDTFRPKMRAHHAAVPDGRPGFYSRKFKSDRMRKNAPFET